MPAHVDNRNAPVIVDGEIETALAFLDYLRQGISRKLDGLTGDQARTARVPSGTSLLGLVKHLAQVEVYWIQQRFAGLDVSFTDDGFVLGDDDTIISVRRAYQQAATTTDDIVREADDPERQMVRTTHGLTLRWALAHVIEETGRHAGHADILRELLDGVTGR